MNHDEATQLMTTEKYLLNELSPEEREEFEEHFFECTECARDLRAGITFIEQSKAILSAEVSTRAAELSAPRSKKGSWLDWAFRPAFVVPVLALLLATIGYLSMAPRSKPQVLSAVFLNVGSRGVNTASMRVHGQNSFLVRVSVPPENQFSSYFVDIYGPDGRLIGSPKVTTSLEDDSYFVQIPAGHHDDGTYTVAVRGVTSAGTTEEVGRTRFDLHVLP